MINVLHLKVRNNVFFPFRFIYICNYVRHINNQKKCSGQGMLQIFSAYNIYDSD